MDTNIDAAITAIQNDVTYQSIAYVVDYFNKRRESQRGDPTVMFFDDYFNLTPPPAFCKVVYGIGQMHWFFQSLQETLGLIRPDNWMELGMAPVPEFVETIRGIYEQQLAREQERIEDVVEKLEACINPSAIVQIAEILARCR